MADAAISFAVEKLGDSLIHKVNFLIGVEDEVRWLKDELESMHCFLKDAAEKQRNNEHGNLLRKWIFDVRELAQDAEDVIEIFSLKVDRGLLEKCACFPAHVSHLNRIGEEIESIRNRLHEIRERRETYGIGKNLGEMGVESSSRSRSEMVERRRLMAARFQKEKDVVGLNEDADLLLNKVILDQGRAAGLSLAAIVGMGGIGKSTLARKIYNHPAIAARFDKCAWVVVSSDFAAEDIMKQIMHELSVPLDHKELKTLESIQGKLRRQDMLQQMLRNRLEGKRYFIVLDDVWEKTHWEALETAFPDERGKASMLVFTSRNQIITEHRGYVHKMKLLTSDESWELLLNTAFIGRSDGRCPHELEDIGREILEKCHGLPLAITVAGGLLVNQEESKSGWQRVLKQIKNYHSETSEIGSQVSAILELSYHNLPSQLKPCFLCLGFFKEDAIIRAKRLVHIWVALGFVEAGEEIVEEIARSYLDELVNRNLVQVKDMAIDDKVRNCHIHDLLRELSIKKAKEEIGFESLIIEEGCSSSSSSSKPSLNKPRHRVVRGMEERLVKIDRLNQNKHLRSLFLNVERPNDNDPYFTTPSYWKGFELLRILDIEDNKFSRLPSTIRALIGLRYLRLRAKGKQRLKLPSWLDVLKNLEVLDIAYNKWVIFPDVTWKMDSLRHLYIDGRCIFPDSMKKSSWKNLETLKYLRSDDLLFGNPIQGGSCRRLRKFGVEVRYGEGEAEIGRLLLDSEVQVVHLRWDIGRDGDLPIPNSLDRLIKLKLHGIVDCFPSADKFPQNITHLTLSHSGITTNDVMQELRKLPNLLVLKFDDAFSYTHNQRMEVSCEGFPRLKVLHLRNMAWFKNIEIEEGGMPQLQRLEIYQCPNFQTESLRKHLGSVEIITIVD